MISLDNKTLFIWITNTKKGVGVYTRIWPFPFTHGHLVIHMMSYFQDANEDNGIHVPFTIGIQTLFQLQTMVSLGDNGTISMDATFATNDVKFHFFTLMMFDAHRTGVLVAWIITSCQTCDDLVEWLTPLKTKLLKKNLK
jgi:hypothetical protein